eukprot:gene30530-35559_t
MDKALSESDWQMKDLLQQKDKAASEPNWQMYGQRGMKDKAASEPNWQMYGQRGNGGCRPLFCWVVVDRANGGKQGDAPPRDTPPYPNHLNPLATPTPPGTLRAGGLRTALATSLLGVVDVANSANKSSYYAQCVKCCDKKDRLLGEGTRKCSALLLHFFWKLPPGILPGLIVGLRQPHFAAAGTPEDEDPHHVGGCMLPWMSRIDEEHTSQDVFGSIEMTPAMLRLSQALGFYLGCWLNSVPRFAAAGTALEYEDPHSGEVACCLG